MSAASPRFPHRFEGCLYSPTPAWVKRGFEGLRARPRGNLFQIRGVGWLLVGPAWFALGHHKQGLVGLAGGGGFLLHPLPEGAFVEAVFDPELTLW